MTPRCDNQISSIGPCNTPLRIDVLPNGRTVETCLRCAARAAGRCWQCGRTRTNHPEFGVYCEPCRKAALARSMKRAKQSPECKERERKHFKEKWKDPAFRALRRERLREWKRKNPDKAKASWARFAAKRKAQTKTGVAA